MTEDLFKAQYDITQKSRLKIFYEKNKKIIFSTASIVFILIVSFIFYLDNLKKKKISLSDDYVQARIYVENGKSKEALILLRSIVFSNDSYYSTLSFFYILEKNLITDRKKIMSLFNHILKKNKFDKEIENLIIFKKAIFESSYLDESDLLKTVGPLINNENLWKPHALMLMGDYFLSKKENLKAKEFYLQILDIKNLNKELYSQAKSQLSSIVND